MDKIKWCMQQKKGIELVEPSDNLRDAYIIKAEEALGLLHERNLLGFSQEMNFIV